MAKMKHNVKIDVESQKLKGDKVLLIMDKKTATILLNVCYVIGGDPDKSPRGRIDALSRALCHAGVTDYLPGLFMKDSEVCYLYFKDYMERK